MLTDIAALVHQSPLVSLVGPGGAGKTRCALQAGADMLDDWTDGVWLVELAKISDPSLVASVCAQALNIEETPNRTALETLLPFHSGQLRARRR